MITITLTTEEILALKDKIGLAASMVARFAREAQFLHSKKDIRVATIEREELMVVLNYLTDVRQILGKNNGMANE